MNLRRLALPSLFLIFVACDEPPPIPEADAIGNGLDPAIKTTQGAATERIEDAKSQNEDTKKRLDPDAG